MKKKTNKNLFLTNNFCEENLLRILLFKIELDGTKSADF